MLIVFQMQPTRVSEVGGEGAPSELRDLGVRKGGGGVGGRHALSASGRGKGFMRNLIHFIRRFLIFYFIIL